MENLAHVGAEGSIFICAFVLVAVAIAKLGAKNHRQAHHRDCPGQFGIHIIQ
jgi:hypothetical protein